MELGISTASIFTNAEPMAVPAILGRMGVKKIEVFLNTFSEYEPDFARALKAHIDDAGLSAYSVHPMSVQFEAQLFSSHPGQKKDAFALYEKVLTAASILGATHYTMHGALHLLGGAGAVRNHRLEKLAKVFKELLDIAEDNGIRLCLENVSWCFYNCPETALALRQMLGDRRLQFVLDIKQAARCGQDPFGFIEAVGEDMGNIHLCDYISGSQGLQLKLPGEGTFPFAAMKRALEKKGYAGPAFIEVYSDMYESFDRLQASYQWLKEQLA